MLQLIETIYILGAIIAISAGLPQIKRLLETKASDEFSLSTWAAWLGTQCSALLYVSVFGTPLLVMVNAMWVGFYCIMLALIIRYRPRQAQPVVIYDTPE